MDTSGLNTSKEFKYPIINSLLPDVNKNIQLISISFITLNIELSISYHSLLHYGNTMYYMNHHSF